MLKIVTSLQYCILCCQPVKQDYALKQRFTIPTIHIHRLTPSTVLKENTFISHYHRELDSFIRWNQCPNMRVRLAVCISVVYMYLFISMHLWINNLTENTFLTNFYVCKHVCVYIYTIFLNKNK